VYTQSPPDEGVIHFLHLLLMKTTNTGIMLKPIYIIGIQEMGEL